MESIKYGLSLNEIASFIAARLGKENDLLLIENIKIAVKYWRVFLLRQEIERYGHNPVFMQSLVVELKTVDAADNDVIESDFPLLRSVNTIPRAINLKTKNPFYVVGTVDERKAFTYVRPAGLLRLTGARFVKNYIAYTYFNDYLYVHCNKIIKYIRVFSAFENPEEVVNNIDNLNQCVDNNVPFPIPLHHLKIIVENIVKGEFQLSIDKQGINSPNINVQEHGNQN